MLFKVRGAQEKDTSLGDIIATTQEAAVDIEQIQHRTGANSSNDCEKLPKTIMDELLKAIKQGFHELREGITQAIVELENARKTEDVQTLTEHCQKMELTKDIDVRLVRISTSNDSEQFVAKHKVLLNASQLVEAAHDAAFVFTKSPDVTLAVTTEGLVHKSTRQLDIDAPFVVFLCAVKLLLGDGGNKSPATRAKVDILAAALGLASDRFPATLKAMLAVRRARVVSQCGLRAQKYVEMRCSD